jgi:hypothetical protein
MPLSVGDADVRAMMWLVDFGAQVNEHWSRH